MLQMRVIATLQTPHSIHSPAPLDGQGNINPGIRDIPCRFYNIHWTGPIDYTAMQMSPARPGHCIGRLRAHRHIGGVAATPRMGYRDLDWDRHQARRDYPLSGLSGPQNGR